MEGIATIVIALILLYLAYRTNLVRATESTVGIAVDSLESGSRLAKKRLDLFEDQQAEKLSKEYGKLEQKLDDSEIKRSSRDRVRSKLAQLDTILEQA